MSEPDVHITKADLEKVRTVVAGASDALTKVAKATEAAMLAFARANTALNDAVEAAEPPRYCKACGERLVRGRQSNGRAEVLSHWLRRRYCNQQCAGAAARKAEPTRGRACRTCRRPLVMGRLEGPTRFNARHYCDRECFNKRSTGSRTRRPPEHEPKRKPKSRRQAPPKQAPAPAAVADVAAPKHPAALPPKPKVVREPLPAVPESSYRGNVTPDDVAAERRAQRLAFEPPRQAGAFRMQVLGEPCPVHPEERVSVYGLCPACVSSESWASQQRDVVIRPAPEGGR